MSNFAGPRPHPPNGKVFAEHELEPKFKTLLTLNPEGGYHERQLSPMPISLGPAYDGSNTLRTREMWPTGVIRSQPRAREIMQQVVDIINAAGGLDLTETERKY